MTDHSDRPSVDPVAFEGDEVLTKMSNTFLALIAEQRQRQALLLSRVNVKENNIRNDVSSMKLALSRMESKLEARSESGLISRLESKFDEMIADYFELKMGMQSILQLLSNHHNAPNPENQRRRESISPPQSFSSETSSYHLSSEEESNQFEPSSAKHAISEVSQETSITKSSNGPKRKRVNRIPKKAPIVLNARCIPDLMDEYKIIKNYIWQKSVRDRYYLSTRRILYQYLEDKGEMFDDENKTVIVLENYRTFHRYTITTLARLFESWSDKKYLGKGRGHIKDLYSELTRQRIDEALRQFVNSPLCYRPDFVSDKNDTMKAQDQPNVG
ncbi:predicted protein [Meyerozyma guilliermondii ATCC 6260]|uniref:Uncharacterized protein n=1 Tax=Meyerozyma guilliermondii (strain ATCC 6260 / CBS 566 / DSM 6381 / JCM 1539 / NBRC 10279 / NRRL Y-324) TaxID=294746 RepID=A5DFQ5_PICGU|nr:uncharacterized protein PGUG_02106 [Meyerozyma guilliermondii ATCC 6260]EDK38008.2 predicted protein [Meyerozyma guilliermondii ATCC 6260]